MAVASKFSMHGSPAMMFTMNPSLFFKFAIVSLMRPGALANEVIGG
jgi:hypothetical protein